MLRPTFAHNIKTLILQDDSGQAAFVRLPREWARRTECCSNFNSVEFDGLPCSSMVHSEEQQQSRHVWESRARVCVCGSDRPRTTAVESALTPVNVGRQTDK